MMDYTHANTFKNRKRRLTNHAHQNKIKIYKTLYFRGDVWPVAVLAPVSLDPWGGGLQTEGLDIWDVSLQVILSLVSHIS